MKFYRNFIASLGIVWLLLIMLPTAALAQQSQKLPLYIDANTGAEDRVGRDFVYQLKEQINKSSSYFVTYSVDNAIFVINIATVSDDNNNNATAYSMVLTVDNKLMTNIV
ncbi:MAG: hypothetical protein LBH10_03085 [Burkholderiaceae bacterium]|nr:hypothetical protein [Burkholderiaceae bacterium]